MQPALLALQTRLQHTFSNASLLQRAITHRSFSADHNERLEFLGDSVLSLAISSLLYAKLASMPEGDLSRVRANLVKEGTLHKIALKLQLGEVAIPVSIVYRFGLAALSLDQPAIQCVGKLLLVGWAHGVSVSIGRCVLACGRVDELL